MYSEYISNIIEYEIKNLPPVVSEWFSKSEAMESVSEIVQSFFRNNIKDNNDSADLKNKNYPDAEKYDFSTHITDLGNGKIAVTLIDIEENENIRKAPVIELVFKNFNMSDLSNEEMEKLTFRYKSFEPEILRYYEFNKNDGTEKKFGAVPENITVAGLIDSVKKLPKNEIYEKVSIEPIDSMDFYTVYSDEYDMFFKSNEAMRNKVDKESFGTLEKLLKFGKLYKAIIDNEFAGVFAIIKNKHLYFRNYFIREEILFKKFRGRGFGYIFQRKIIEALPEDEIKIICGMIHSENISSLRTAFKCGRSAIETNFLIKLKN